MLNVLKQKPVSPMHKVGYYFNKCVRTTILNTLTHVSDPVSVTPITAHALHREHKTSCYFVQTDFQEQLTQCSVMLSFSFSVRLLTVALQISCVFLFYT